MIGLRRIARPWARTLNAQGIHRGLPRAAHQFPHDSTTTAPPSPAPPPPPPSSPPPESSLSKTSRLRVLFRTHGWSALTIYLLLSLADFSLTFLLIYFVGAEKVRSAEDWVLDALGWRRKDGEMGRVKKAVEGWKESHGHGKAQKGIVRTTEEAVVAVGGGGGETTKKEDKLEGYSAIATTAVLAYAIHKTLLLPVRIGLTVAITPRIVRTMRAWGSVYPIPLNRSIRY